MRTLGSLAGEYAIAHLARAPVSGVSLEAAAVRALEDGVPPGVFEGASDFPGLPSALAHAYTELRQAGWRPRGKVPERGAPLDALVERMSASVDAAGMADRATVLEAAAERLRAGPAGLPTLDAVVLLDLPMHHHVERLWANALVDHARRALAVFPTGETAAAAFAEERGENRGGLRGSPGSALAEAQDNDPSPSETGGPLSTLRARIFTPSIGEPIDDAVAAKSGASIRFVSAPGVGRECMEIARDILRRVGTQQLRFDRTAVVLRDAGCV